MDTQPKILVIEDETIIAKAYKEGLERAGMNVVIAGDGQQGLDLIASFQPHLILLDLFLPVKDGFAVLEEMKAQKLLGKIPVIILTVSGSDAAKYKAKEYGVIDYLIKSDYGMDEVIDRVKFRLGQI